MNGGESPSPAGSEGEGGPDSSEGTPGGAPGGNGEDWEESFATWWDNESPSSASPIPEISKRERVFQKWRKSFGENPRERRNKFKDDVGAGMFDASIFKAVLSAAGAKPKSDTGGKEKKEKEIRRLKDLEKTQKEEIERLEAERTNRENEAS
jgi:hypothetical protein